MTKLYFFAYFGKSYFYLALEMRKWKLDSSQNQHSTKDAQITAQYPLPILHLLKGCTHNKISHHPVNIHHRLSLKCSPSAEVEKKKVTSQNSIHLMEGFLSCSYELYELLKCRVTSDMQMKQNQV